jgi:fermentation-respiration switch protein FrsA (DUF1100 family)
VILARFTAITRLPAMPFAAALMAFGTIDFGTSPWNVQPAALAARLRKPLLAIVGGQDPVVPPVEGLTIFNAALGPKQLLYVPAAGHGADALPSPDRDQVAVRVPSGSAAIAFAVAIRAIGVQTAGQFPLPTQRLPESRVQRP